MNKPVRELKVGDTIVESTTRTFYVRKIVKHRDGRTTVHYTMSGWMLGNKMFEPGAEVTIR